MVNQIGFTDIEYIGKNPVGDSNYDFLVDGYSVTLTASDDVYRIFNRQTVYYEDGQVKNTVAQADEKRISQDDATYYYVIAQEIVESHLKSPKSAKFPSASDVSYQKKGNIVAVKGYVDAKNSFNAKIRGEWIVEFEVIDLKNFSYNTIYVNIDGDTGGEWVSLE